MMPACRTLALGALVAAWGTLRAAAPAVSADLGAGPPPVPGLAACSFEMGVYRGFTFSGLLGYRALSVDFEKGSAANRFELDVVHHGPVLGLTVRF
jgi:hypothetical protein